MRISDWSSDVCSSDLDRGRDFGQAPGQQGAVDVAADEQADQILVLRERGPLLRDRILGGRKDLFGLAEVGARRAAAVEPRPGEPHAFARVGGGARGTRKSVV